MALLSYHVTEAMDYNCIRHCLSPLVAQRNPCFYYIELLSNGYRFASVETYLDVVACDLSGVDYPICEDNDRLVVCAKPYSIQGLLLSARAAK